MTARLESSCTPARGKYDEDAAELRLWIPGTDLKATFDETEVDAMLAVCEYSMDPAEDLSELFEEDFGRLAYRVAQLIVCASPTLATLIYA